MCTRAQILATAQVSSALGCITRAYASKLCIGVAIPPLVDFMTSSDPLGELHEIMLVGAYCPPFGAVCAAIPFIGTGGVYFAYSSFQYARRFYRCSMLLRRLTRR